MVYEIAKAAYNNQNIMSTLIGNPESFVIKRLSEDGIPFYFHEQNKLVCKNISAESDDLMINFHNFDGLNSLREFNGKTVIWGILAPQITEWNRFGVEKRLTGKKTVGNFFTKKLLLSMSYKNALISMDGATSDAIDEFFGIALNLPIISIPVDIKDTRASKKGTILRNTLQISYIGRSDDIWKIKPVKKIMQDLKKIENTKFILNIYTDHEDPYISELKEVCASNISIEYHIGLYGPQMRTDINMRSELHFSMGTAALEGALSGVATILIDPCIYDFPSNYKYKWLFQTNRNSLGRFIESEEIHFSGMDMSEIIDICFDEHRRHIIAESCSQYVIQNHSASVVTEKLLECPTQAEIKDIFRFTPATWSGVANLKNIF